MKQDWKLWTLQYVMRLEFWLKKKKVSYITHIHKAIIQCEHYGVL